MAFECLFVEHPAAMLTFNALVCDFLWIKTIPSPAELLTELLRLLFPSRDVFALWLLCGYYSLMMNRLYYLLTSLLVLRVSLQLTIITIHKVCC